MRFARFAKSKISCALHQKIFICSNIKKRMALNRNLKERINSLEKAKIDEKNENKKENKNEKRSEKKEASEGSAGSKMNLKELLFAGSIVFNIILVVLLAYSSLYGQQSRQNRAILPEQLKAKIESYFKNNYNMTLYVINVNETNGLYAFEIMVNGHLIPGYALKNGSMLFLQAVNLDEPVVITTTSKGEFSPQKSSAPDVKLFVMSFCPYGTQAEEFMYPVYNLLKNYTNISIVYILESTQNPSSLADFSSLHGSKEVKEDARQLCILGNYGKDAFWDYLMKFKSNCYNQQVLSSDQLYENCTESVEKSLNINSTLIQNCINGQWVINELKKNVEISRNYGVGASPTLIINNSTYYDQYGRSAQTYQKVICSAFLSQPSECGKNVTNVQTAPVSGHC